MAIFLLLSFLDEPPAFASWQLDLLEFFAGTARVSRLAVSAGFNTGTHDIDYDRSAFKEGSEDTNPTKGGRSAMDMNQPSGFALLPCV